MKTIGQIIKEKRKSRNWSQQKLADKIDVNHSTLSTWESGRSLPNLIYCIALAEVFECTIDELCGVTR
jgi:DNA-binding XRE family transcriptional regulator